MSALRDIRSRAQATVLTAALALSVLSTAGCGSDGQSGNRSKRLSYDDASGQLKGLLDRVTWRERFVTDREQVDIGAKGELAATLPDIDQFPMVVEPSATGNDVVVEIFSSSEKAGKGDDGWLVEVANDFNSSARPLSSGGNGKVRVRKIPSGTAYQYIASGKYRPHGYTPSNILWIKMAEAHGVAMSPVADSLVRNVAGVVMTSETAAKIQSGTTAVDMTALVDAVIRGDIAMGYTNPFASSTGLNFLVSILGHFSEGKAEEMLSPAVISAFEGFQRGVPYVALTTLQMRDSVTSGGSLDAFVMERQTYAKTSLLQSGYEFLPFGVRHDNPLYAVGQLSSDQSEVLEQLAAHASKYERRATEYGFNSDADYAHAYTPPPGDVLVKAQRIWKEKKNAGRPVAAVFLADVSGSMGGSKIASVRKALRKGAEFISPENSVGLVLFNDEVTVTLPIKPFGLNHRATFLAAVNLMDTGGGTAMYDGIAVALSLLAAEKAKNPEVKPILLTLSDGESADGMRFEIVNDVIRGMRVPVYTIGFEANLPELRRVSALVEAATINATEGDVGYKIGALLNAQL